ncbi:PLC-like phosphodiesterase, partial [Phakopsora pachyrhizi]
NSSSSSSTSSLSSASVSSSSKPQSKGAENKTFIKQVRKSKSIQSLVSASLVGAFHFDPPPPNLAVAICINNSTGWPIRMAHWPSKARRNGPNAFSLSRFRGNCINESSIPSVTELITDKFAKIAMIDRPSLAKTLKSRKPAVGWIYFDVLKSDGYVLHLQGFVKLDRSGQVSEASLGRFDLDSSRQRPMPSGVIGSVNVTNTVPCMVSLNLTLEDLVPIENSVNDTPLRPPIVLPTKGLSLFSYVSHPDVIVSFRAGKDGRYHEGQPSRTGNLDYTSKFARTDHILGGVENLLTMLCIQHRLSLSPILHRSVSINPLRVEGNKQTPLASTFETPSIISKELDVSVSYGFHDSRLGKRHSLYTYVTKCHSSWLGDLINENPKWLEVRFSRLVLQGSHDSGMFTRLHPGFTQMITGMKLDSDIGNFLIDHGISFVKVLTKLLKGLNIEIERAICNISNTQKDNFSNQLLLGVRFFDFRPGYCFHDCVNGERGKIHHQHACVPGYEYVSALVETLCFLADHPSEIVIYELKSDGFVARKTTWRKDSIPFHSMIPTKAALNAALDEARLIAKNVDLRTDDIIIGNQSDLDRTIGDLLEQNSRLMIINRMGDEPELGWDWVRDDSYGLSDYILWEEDQSCDKLNRKISKTRNSSHGDLKKPLPGTIYQLQATPTKSITDDIVTSLTYSKASSLLVYTKSCVDPVTYDWIRQRHFIEPGEIIYCSLNDFVDSVLTEHAIEKSKIRAGFFNTQN